MARCTYVTIWLLKESFLLYKQSGGGGGGMQQWKSALSFPTLIWNFSCALSTKELHQSK